MHECILELTNYGIAFDDKQILNNLTLKVPVKGVLVLMGPMGTGKSTLLRTLSGTNDASPSLRTWGEANYMGVPLGQSLLPELVAQKTRLMMASIRENIICELPERQSLDLSQQRDICMRLLQLAGLDQLKDKLDDNVITLPLGIQRHLAIVRTTASNPNLIMIDEPTTDIDDKHCDQILEYLIQEGKRRAVLVVLHNQKHARTLGGYTALLAGGKIQEMQPTNDFFENPVSSLAKDFALSGSCCASIENTADEAVAYSEELSKVDTKDHSKPQYLSHAFGPRNFFWLKQGELAGTPRPGLVYDLDYDLEALERVGIKVLVSLTSIPIDAITLEQYGIHGIWFPIVDMGCPKIDETIIMCEKVNNYILDGKPVAMHCRAGMGRTGTMLVAQLIWEGKAALDALEAARRIEPRWVQSEIQVDFLEKFSLTVNKCAKP